MKLSVSLSSDDVEFIDRYAATHSFSSRSAALQAAVRALRENSLTAEYRDAFEEWDQSPDSELWDQTSADGV